MCSDVRDLICRCLSVVPADRPSLEDILAHHWMMELSKEAASPYTAEAKDVKCLAGETVAARSPVDAVSNLCDSLSDTAVSSILSRDFTDISTALFDPSSAPSQGVPSPSESVAVPSSERCVELFGGPEQSSHKTVELCAKPPSLDKCVELFAEPKKSADVTVSLYAEPFPASCVELCSESASPSFFDSSPLRPNRTVELSSDSKQSLDAAVTLYAQPTLDSCVELCAGTEHSLNRSADLGHEMELGLQAKRSFSKIVELCAEPPSVSSFEHSSDTVELFPAPSSDTCVELCASDESLRIGAEAKDSFDQTVELCAEPSRDGFPDHLSDRTVALFPGPPSDTFVELCAGERLCVEAVQIGEEAKKQSFHTTVELCGEPASDSFVGLAAEHSSDRTVELFPSPSLDHCVELCSGDQLHGKAISDRRIASSQCSDVDVTETLLKRHELLSGRDGCVGDTSAVFEPTVSTSLSRQSDHLVTSQCLCSTCSAAGRCVDQSAPS